MSCELWVVSVGFICSRRLQINNSLVQVFRLECNINVRSSLLTWMQYVARLLTSVKSQVLHVWCLQPGGCLQLIYTKTMSLLIFPSAATCYGQHLFLKNRWELQAEPANDSPASWVWRLRVWRLASKVQILQLYSPTSWVWHLRDWHLASTALTLSPTLHPPHSVIHRQIGGIWLRICGIQ